MIYKVVNTPEADEDLIRLAKNEPKVFLKAMKFIEECASIRRRELVIQNL